MKFSIHNTESQALEENQRLMGLLNIPTASGTLNYGLPEEIDGKWCIRLKEFGAWKADDLAVNVQELSEPVQEIE